MFRRISVLLALQFTVFVALLLLVNGALFIAADYQTAQRLLDDRLILTSNRVITRLQSIPDRMSINLLPNERDMVRVVDIDGNIIYEGAIFESLPFDPRVREFSDITFDDMRIHLLTSPILQSGNLLGWLQVGRIVDAPGEVLTRRILLSLATTACISFLTFFIGLFFAKRSLKPAEETMKRLEQFTQDASHELRTPLAVLRSSLDLALKTENYRDGILSAKEDLTRITQLTEKLLELARLDKLALQKEPVDLSSLVERSALDLSALAEHKGVTLVQDVAPGIAVQADPTLVRQMLENLVGNAIKFTPEGGNVSVTLKGGQLVVDDTGPGIAPGELERIFDRFYQSDGARASGGFGLGLALVKRIVDLHGWSVTAQSMVGKGTAFTVAFTPQR